MAEYGWVWLGESGDLRRIFRKGTSPGSLLTFKKHVHGVNGKPTWASRVSKVLRGVVMASKSADIRPKITMACVDCKERNYITKKNRRNDPDRMELKKFCPRCKLSTVHRETR